MFKPGINTIPTPTGSVHTEVRIPIFKALGRFCVTKKAGKVLNSAQLDISALGSDTHLLLNISNLGQKIELKVG